MKVRDSQHSPLMLADWRRRRPGPDNDNLFENGEMIGPLSSMEHISDHDLERYHLGMIRNETELALIEEHLLVCTACIEAAENAADDVDIIRAACAELE